MRTFATKPKATQQTSVESAKAPRTLSGQRRDAHSILQLQRTTGNLAARRLLRTGSEVFEVDRGTTTSNLFAHDFSRIPVHVTVPERIQLKLTVDTPGDTYEREADRITNQVVHMAKPQSYHTCAGDGGCPKCRHEQGSHEHVQTKRVQATDSREISAPPIVHEVLNSPGQVLDPDTRAFMEPRFGHSFGQVRVHADSRAAAAAAEMNANAFTVGRNIVFGEGQFTPHSLKGRRLMTHELTHVVQQGVAPPLPTLPRQRLDQVTPDTDSARAEYRPSLLTSKLSDATPPHVHRSAPGFEQGSAASSPVGTLVLQRQSSEPQEPRIPRIGEPVRSDPTPALGPLPELPLPFSLPFDIYTYIAERWAAHHYDNPLHGELVHHYMWGYGADFHLSPAQMRQVIAPRSDHLNILGDPSWTQVQQVEDALVTQVPASPDGKASLPVQATATLHCDRNLPSLGDFTGRISGVVTGYLGSSLRDSESGRIPARRWNPDDVYWHFMGTMIWEDWWDFDPHVPDPHGSMPQTRLPDAEEGVRRAHDYLPGTPFRVISDTVPVSQDPDTTWARW